MACIVRVELFENDSHEEGDYDELHKIMAAKAFYRTIRGDDENWYWLPPATYLTTSESSMDVVFDKALATVRAFWLHSSVTVVDATEVYCEGLRSASRNDRNQERAGRRPGLRRLAIGSDPN